MHLRCLSLSLPLGGLIPTIWRPPRVWHEIILTSTTLHHSATKPTLAKIQSSSAPLASAQSEAPPALAIIQSASSSARRPLRPAPPSAHEGRDENGWKRSRKHFNHYRNRIFWRGMGAGTEKLDGNTKPILRDIGNRIVRSVTSRLRLGNGNSKREHRCVLPLQTFISTK